MNKTLLVMRNEIITTARRPSFLLVAFGLPMVAMIVMLIASLMNRASPPAATDAGTRSSPTQAEGFVDRSGIIKLVPAGIPPRSLIAFPDEAAARQSLQSGSIQAYYVVAEDYVRSGRIDYVHPRASLTLSDASSWTIRWTLLVNMLGGDTALASSVWAPMDLKVTSLARQQRAGDNASLDMLPYAVAFVLYVVLIMATSLLRNSTGEERKNRVQEILLMSVSPQQLLAGKIAGLGVVGLGQMLLWAVITSALLRIGGQTFSFLAGFDLPASFIVWATIFFLLGYAVYGSLLAGLGALTGPNVPGSSTADFVIIWPSFLPLLFWMVTAEDPHGALSVGLSLFPLTAPVGMLLRLVAGDVPLWQTVLSALLMAVTAYAVLRAVARVFRAQLLLTGQTMTAGRFLAVLLRRA
jgi:ABC-2 type transport system permease protein